MRDFAKTRRLAKTHWLLLLAGLAIAGIVGCAGCRKGDAASLAYAPEDAGVVVYVPNLTEAMRNINQLTGRFSDNLAVNMLVQKYKQALVQELGFDLERPETARDKGVDPAQGVVVSVSNDGASAAAVLGVANQRALDQYLRAMATKLFGGRATFKEQGGATVLTLQGSQLPTAAWIYRREHVIIALRARGGKVAEYVAQLTEQRRGVRDNTLFKEMQSKLGAHSAMVYVNGAALKRWAQRAAPARGSAALLASLRGAAAGLHASAKGVEVRAYAAGNPENAKHLRTLLRGKGKAPAFGELISPDALAVGRCSLDLKQLMDRASPDLKRRLYRDFDGVERQTKISVERDVLGVLGGRFALAFFPPDGSAITRGFPFNLRDETAVNPVAALALVHVVDQKKAADLLPTIERMIAQAGIPIRTRTEEQQTIYSIGNAERPMVSWTLLDDIAVIGTNDRLSKALALRRKGGENVLGQIVNPRARKLFKADEGCVLYYSLRKTAEAISGAGLSAEVKLMLSSVVPTLARFVDITWSVEAEQSGVSSEIVVRLD